MGSEMCIRDSAPLEAAATGLLNGAFSNSGQTCISIERVYVEEPVFAEFSRRIAEGASRLKIGWSASWDTDVGSLIHSAHAAKVMRHIEDAVTKGARVLAGGRRRQDIGPSFVEPTVLSNVQPDMLIADQETFGPVITLYPVQSAQEGIQRANDSAFGLNATIWSGNSGESKRIARLIETGSINVNSTLMVYNSFDAPMGGVKLSGVGRRHGEQGILRYTQAQSIVTSFAAGGGYDAILSRLTTDRRVRGVLAALRWWRRI